jgi:hypothetical protein
MDLILKKNRVFKIFLKICRNWMVYETEEKYVNIILNPGKIA